MERMPDIDKEMSLPPYFTAANIADGLDRSRVRQDQSFAKAVLTSHIDQHRFDEVAQELALNLSVPDAESYHPVKVQWWNARALQYVVIGRGDDGELYAIDRATERFYASWEEGRRQEQ